MADKIQGNTEQSDGATAQANADDVKSEPGQKGQKSDPVMNVRVSSPFKVFFDQEALSISGSNATGPFDILPHHHNFISLLSEGELSVRTRDSKATRIKISGGIMHVKADRVVVFLNV